MKMFSFRDGCSTSRRTTYNVLLSVMKFGYFKTKHISPITALYFNYSILNTIQVI